VKALSVSGGPVIVKSLQEMGVTYKKTRAALKEDLPQIMKAKGEIEKLELRIAELGSDMVKLKTDFKSGVIDEDTMKAKEAAIREEINKIRACFLKIDAVQGGLAHIMSAVDPLHIKTVIGQIYTSLLAGAAAVTSQSAAAITMGINIGKVFHKFVDKLFSVLKTRLEHNKAVIALEQVLENNAAWWRAASQTVAHAAGVIAAYCLKETTIVLSACALGSHMLLEAVEDICDPFLERMRLPTLKRNPPLAAAIQGGALAFGVLNQMRHGGDQIPRFLRILMSPIFFVETLIDMLLIT
jgi:hypothetical protein